MLSDEKGKMNLRERRGAGGGGGGGYWRAGDKGSLRRRGHDRLGSSHKRVRPHCKQTIPLPLGCTLQINTHRFSFFFSPPLLFPSPSKPNRRLLPQQTESRNRGPARMPPRSPDRVLNCTNLTFTFHGDAVSAPLQLPPPPCVTKLL